MAEDVLVPNPAATPARVWKVGALCRAVADALEARFNPVTVQGEISGISRAASGHCYFSVKDEQGQIRCAMFRRAASLLDFSPRDGELVELRGRLGVYEQRGDLQLIVESMRRAGQGAWFEQFAQLKAKLEQQGLFDAARKRPLPRMPRAIGVVTSLGAAALHDVVTALRRRVPHIPVVVAPALVQGNQAAPDLVRALSRLYLLARSDEGSARVDVILLVRGGGSIEDLWSFNDEQLALCIAQSPVPVVCGVGHETDFSIADFCADLRAPTPTAAAEMVCEPQEVWLRALEQLQQRLAAAALRRVDSQSQRLDYVGSRLGRPSTGLARAPSLLTRHEQRLRYACLARMGQCRQVWQSLQSGLPQAVGSRFQGERRRLEQLELRLRLLDPGLVLQRGYAWLHDGVGHAITSVHQTRPGLALVASLADGKVDLTVNSPWSK
ncbi:MAG: exodeoxyribonuclease VII large subunit [Betaproteobacteria bacterium]